MRRSTSKPGAAAHVREQGFTLLEMIVVLVILGIAMASIFPTITNMLESSSRQSSMSHADGDVKVAAKLFESDLRGARGYRSTGDRNGINMMGMSGGMGVSTVGSLSMNNPQVHDIVAAGPTRLVVNSDVSATAGIEQVTWNQLVDDTVVCGPKTPNWCVTRQVVSAAGATLSNEVLLSSRGAFPTTSACASDNALNGQARIFCYQESYPTNKSYDYTTWVNTCDPVWDSSLTYRTLGTRYQTVHNAVDGGTFIDRLDRITAVGASFQSGGSFKGANERSYQATQISIRSRETPSYREAIMCGSRMGWVR